MKIEVEIWMEFQLMKGSSSNPGEESKHLLRRTVFIMSPRFQDFKEKKRQKENKIKVGGKA